MSIDRSTMATVPAPRPDPVPALAALADRIAADRALYASGERQLSPTDAARLRRLIGGEGCADCGRPPLRGERQCRACAIRDVEATG